MDCCERHVELLHARLSVVISQRQDHHGFHSRSDRLSLYQTLYNAFEKSLQAHSLLVRYLPVRLRASDWVIWEWPMLQSASVSVQRAAIEDKTYPYSGTKVITLSGPSF